MEKKGKKKKKRCVVVVASDLVVQTAELDHLVCDDELSEVLFEVADALDCGK